MLVSVVKYLDTTQQALAQELHKLKQQQYEAINKAIYLRRTPDEIKQFEMRRDRIHQLSEMLHEKLAS